MSHGPYLIHDPISLTLAANLEKQSEKSKIDSVWQLEIPSNDLITLKTSFGLRAQSFKIFPVFMVNKVGRRKTDSFLAAPQIRKIWADHIQLSLNPCPDCLAVYDLWAAAPHLLESRILLKNIGSTTNELGARVAAQLLAFDPKSGMSLTKRKNQNYLKGESEGLQISLIMDGQIKPVISPELALENTKFLQPNESLSIFWRCKVSETSKPEDDRIFSIFPVNWDAEMARLELSQQTQETTISTPHVDWDIAFRMVQLQAQQLLERDEREAPGLTARQTRNPHTQMVPLSTNANSMGPKPPALSALGLWQLIHTMLPARIEDAALLYETYIEQLPKPISHAPLVALSFPILCQLGWTLHSYLQDQAFFQRVYPALRSQLYAWFWTQNDRDQDGLPEWFSFDQTELVDHPVFDILESKELVTPISNVESVGLAALLQKECQALQFIARSLEDSQTEKVVQSLQARLEIRLDEMREANLICRDRDSHNTQSAKILYEGTAQNLPSTPIALEAACRLNLKIKPDLQLQKPGGLKLHGLDQHGNPLSEDILPADIHWLPGHFLYASKNLFSRFDGLSGDLKVDTQLTLYQADLNTADISHLLAWNPNKEIPTLQEIMNQWLPDESGLASYGLPGHLPMPKPEDANTPTNIAWNGLFIQHLLTLGEKEMAFKCFEQLMHGAIRILKREHALFEKVTSQIGQASGKSNDLAGLIPLSLFLDILGVKIYSPTKVTISGTNPVPWPVTIRHMGLEITRDQKNSKITLPDGSSHHHFGSATKTFTME